MAEVFGLKTAVINQLDQFRADGAETTPENIAASFERSAIDMIMQRLLRAVEDTGVRRVVVGGGVAANTYLRRRLSEVDFEVFIPPFRLCTDNGAMIAGLGYHALEAGHRSGLEENARSRVPGFRKTYP